MTLTAKALNAAQPGAVIWDDKVTGLHLRALQTKKVFCFYYRNYADQQRRPTIGEWPTISIEKAREIAKGWAEVVAAGKDPVEQREARAAVPTVAELCDRYMVWSKANKKRWDHDEDYCEKYIKPKMGHLRTDAVVLADIEDLLLGMAETPIQANRVRACLSKMFNLAEKWTIRPLNTNPVLHSHRYKERKRRRYAKPEEAVAIFDRLVFYGEQYPEQAAFLWLLIYTGARPIEIANARPEQRTGSVIVLSDHKTAHSTGDDRVIFLPPQAVAVLDKLGKTRDGTITGIQSPRHLWRKILKDTKLQDANLRMYDLRHSFASASLASGQSLSQIGELLGHKSPETTKRYAHLMTELGVAKAAASAGAIDAMVAEARAKKEAAE